MIGKHFIIMIIKSLYFITYPFGWIFMRFVYGSLIPIASTAVLIDEIKEFKMENKKFNGKLIWLLLFIIGISYREVQILIDRGSWKKEDYIIPLWYIKWTSKWKNFDSFHTLIGLSILFLLEYLVEYLPRYDFIFIPAWLNYQVYVITYWLIFFQIRNLFMHKIFKKKIST